MSREAEMATLRTTLSALSMRLSEATRLLARWDDGASIRPDATPDATRDFLHDSSWQECDLCAQWVAPEQQTLVDGDVLCPDCQEGTDG